MDLVDFNHVGLIGTLETIPHRGSNMRKAGIFWACVAYVTFTSNSHAQTLITVKAYSNPFYESAASVSSMVLEAKTVVPITCGSTSTSTIKFVLNSGSYDQSGNLHFILVSEIINAVRNEYPIEISQANYNTNISACMVGRWFIHIQ